MLGSIPYSHTLSHPWYRIDAVREPQTHLSHQQLCALLVHVWMVIAVILISYIAQQSVAKNTAPFIEISK